MGQCLGPYDGLWLQGMRVYARIWLQLLEVYAHTHGGTCLTCASLNENSLRIFAAYLC